MSHDDLASALQDTLLEITRIPSPIGEEKALCDHVEARLTNSLGASAVERFHDSLVVRALRNPGKPRIGLVGHLDTVRTRHDGPARVEGDRLYGAGAADMKSGLAVMIELAERLQHAPPPVELTLVFYEREEGPYEENRLGPLLESFPELHSLDLAICLEPSDNTLQLGCMGSVHTTLRFLGRTAHSARPWQGENAILKATSVLDELYRREPNQVIIDELEFNEVLSPTYARAGRGRNVVPDEFELNLNYRFAPGRTPEEVVDEIRAWIGNRAVVIPTDLSPSCRPYASHPLVQHLTRCGVRSVQVKQAWTDVARFDRIGVPAVNFGPGTQAQAHQENEYTRVSLLSDGFSILKTFLQQLPA